VAQHLRAWIAYGKRDAQIYYWRTRSGVEVDFVVYGEAGFWAMEVKNTTRVRPEDLGGLKRFAADYPECEPLLLYRGRPEIDRLVAAAAAAAPLHDFATADGVTHTVWRLDDPGPYERAFDGVARAYVADGHHRSAGAWRAARELRARGPGQSGAEEYNWFPAVLVPADQLRILAYNRVVTALAGRTPADVLAELGRVGRLAVTDDPVPRRPATFCVYVGGRWHGSLAEDSIDRSDPIRALDASLLQERVLGRCWASPIRHGQADRFRRAASAAAALAARVDPARRRWRFAPPPRWSSSAVSDAGDIMPPKSTWFEPKLLSGLFVHSFA
jgi:uncharacterized protein (DUF1015 family)